MSRKDHIGRGGDPWKNWEKVHNRGVAFTPKKGGRVVVYRRAVPLG